MVSAPCASLLTHFRGLVACNAMVAHIIGGAPSTRSVNLAWARVAIPGRRKHIWHCTYEVSVCQFVVEAYSCSSKVDSAVSRFFPPPALSTGLGWFYLTNFDLWVGLVVESFDPKL